MRTFDTGATRDTDEGKLDYEGFLSPLVLKRFAEYMHKNRIQADGNLRPADNWQKGIPQDQYIKSLWRHFMDLWMAHDGWPIKDHIEDVACAILFNTMGWLHERLAAQLKPSNPYIGSSLESLLDEMDKPIPYTPTKHRNRK